MQLKKGQLVEVVIERMAFGGRGIGTFEDGRTIFVPGTMPGDKVSASLRRIKQRYLEADLVEVVEGAAERAEPRCQYFERCGGCQLQFMPYEQQLEFKRQHVIDAFERIGGMRGIEVDEIVGCEDQYYYRNKMEFSFGYDAEMNFALGLHIPKRRYDILDIEQCYLQSPTSVAIVNRVREFVAKRDWAPYKYSNGEGFLRSMYVREGRGTNERMVNLMVSEDEPVDLEEGLAEMSEILGEDVTSFYVSTVISRRGERKRIEERLIRGKKTLTEKMQLASGGELSFEILPQAFFQVNTKQAERLYNEVLKLVTSQENQTVFDLFCGTGTIGLFLARHCEKVLGIEINESAVEVAKENARINGVENVEFFVGDVAKLLEGLAEPPSMIVVDPPRAGLSEKIAEQIDGFGVDKLVYVSCNPSTLARDCKWLAEYGFRVTKVVPVDMFPQTFHIETVCLLER